MVTGAGSKQEENTSLSFQNTCDEALAGCKTEPTCKTALAAVMQYCSPSSCRKDQCMHSLQNFYRSVDHKWSLEIAFCLCK
ncbi:unnamed protein product [Nezara viridula]|uniref:GDNF/GAS1 domain-containing protein n=1 Tax=Nezara viridula TaxID=85310 RepID=A0A9P0H1I7_NEZVI|nr:unnamed protein product [Nezara viridula]